MLGRTYRGAYSNYNYNSIIIYDSGIARPLCGTVSKSCAGDG